MAGPWEKYRGAVQPVIPVQADPLAVRREDRMAGSEAERIALERQRLAVTQQTAANTNARATQAQQLAAQAAQRAADISKREQAEKLAPLNAMANQIARVRELYGQGPGATPSWSASSLMDYLPTDKNKAFDTAGRGLGQLGMAAFRVPGVGSQSDAELRDFIETNRPSASDNDVTIREKIRNLETRLTEAYRARGVQYRPKTGTRGAPRKPNAGWKIERLD